MPKRKGSVFYHFKEESKGIFKCNYCMLVKYKRHATRMTKHLLECSDSPTEVKNEFSSNSKGPSSQKKCNNFMDRMTSEEQVCTLWFDFWSFCTSWLLWLVTSDLPFYLFFFLEKSWSIIGKIYIQFWYCIQPCQAPRFCEIRKLFASSVQAPHKKSNRGKTFEHRIPTGQGICRRKNIDD